MYREGIGQSEGAQGMTWHEGKVHRCSLTRTSSIPFLCLRNLRISVHDLWASLALRSQSQTTKAKKGQAIDQKSFSLLILSIKKGLLESWILKSPKVSGKQGCLGTWASEGGRVPSGGDPYWWRRRLSLCLWDLQTNTCWAPHSRTLAWKIPWTEEPGRLQSMGSLRVRHDWATSL